MHLAPTNAPRAAHQTFAQPLVDELSDFAQASKCQGNSAFEFTEDQT